MKSDAAHEENTLKTTHIIGKSRDGARLQQSRLMNEINISGSVPILRWIATSFLAAQVSLAFGVEH